MSSLLTRSFPRCGTLRRRRSRREVVLRTAFGSIPRSNTTSAHFLSTSMGSSHSKAVGPSSLCSRTMASCSASISINKSCIGREIHQISIEPLVNGDGLLLDGGDLLVVQGGPPAMVTFVRLNGKADGGSVVERRTDPSLRESSTIARARNFYLIVNPDFSNLATPFTVTGLPRNYDDDDE